MDTITIHPPTSDVDWSGVSRMFGRYFEWLAEMADLDDVTSVQPSVTDELDDLAATYSRPGHRLLLARQGGVAVGTIAVIPTVDPGAAEIVRLYARPAARGSGIGRRLLHAAIDAGRDLGYERLVLETCDRFMHDAIALYERNGFVRSDRVCKIPVDGMVSYVKDLTAP